MSETTVIEDIALIQDDGRAHYVYRHFDAYDDLLYVGVTCDPKRRPYAHRRKPWWPDVARTEVSEAMGRRAAYRAEWVAIRDEAPAWNARRHNGYITVKRFIVDKAKWDAYVTEAQIRCAEATGMAFRAAGIGAKP